MSRDPRAKTLTASASRPAGRGNHAAADRLRGWSRLLQLRTGPQGRDAARARNRAQHPPRARRRDAADDRRAAGDVADQRAAGPRFRQLPPHRHGLSRAVWQGRRRAGGRPRRPSAVLLGHGGHREPSAAQQSRHRREGVRNQKPAILQPVHRRREEAADRDRRGAGASRRRGHQSSSRSARRSRFSRPSSKSSARARTGRSRSSTAKASISRAFRIRRKRSASAPRRRCTPRCFAHRKPPCRRCRSKACR